MSANLPWVRRSTVVVLARVANAAFFLVTSLYCLLTYSSFAYQQFIRPHLINWLSGFVVWHHLGFWLALLITGWTLLPELRRDANGHKSRIASFLAWSYLAVSTVIGMLLLVWPVLPQVENNGRGLALALAALLPPIWLAVFDHYRHLPAAAISVSSEMRVWRALLLAGVVVWLGQLVAIPWRLDQTGEIRLTGEAISFGILMSGAGHLLMFAGLTFLIVVILRAKRFAPMPGQAEYWLLAAAATVALSLIIDRQVFGAIAFRGTAAWAMSIVLAVMLVLTWSSIAFMIAEMGAETTAVEIWVAPMPGVRSRLASTVILTGLVLVQFALLAYVTPFDWDFVLLKLSVLVVWFAAFAYGFGALSNLARPLRWLSLAAPALAGVVLFAGAGLSQSRIGAWMGGSGFVPDFALEGYVAVDPSYRFIHDTLRMESQEDAEFFAHLRAHSLIQHTSVDPIEIDFVSPRDIDQTRRAPHEDVDSGLPNIFLFVIDSLRRDYLSAYNPAVTFTPGIGEFARDSVVFERAFTRYGGTGLAVPAIWTGGMLLHKQYVTPFDPMNTLLKMLEAGHYRRLMSMDSIVVQLIEPPPASDELDRDVPIMSYRLCQTLEDLKGKLTAGMRTPLSGGGPRPVFAYSLPQDLHISHIRSRPVPAGKSYPGFFAPVAAQVEEMDACFGRFVAFLKETGLYEESVIVITSDHGDSLGEGLRWGHSYTMFPEVSRIPLIVRIPGPLQRRYRADPETVSLSTDLTPTFYALAGHMPQDLGPLYGRPLFVRHDSDLSARRHDPQLIASSYGGVYAVLRDNGTRLYIADGVNKREYAYDLHGETVKRVGVVPSERGPNRQFIRQQIDELARRYRFRQPE